MFLVLDEFDVRALACAFRFAIFDFKAIFNRSSRVFITFFLGIVFLSIASSYIMKT